MNERDRVWVVRCHLRNALEQINHATNYTGSFTPATISRERWQEALDKLDLAENSINEVLKDYYPRPE